MGKNDWQGWKGWLEFTMRIASMAGKPNIKDTMPSTTMTRRQNELYQ